MSAAAADSAATTANFSGSFSGDVAGTQNATSVNSIGGKTSAQVAASVNDTTNAASQIVRRDASGNFAAGAITANNLTITNNASITGTQTTFGGANGFVAGGASQTGTIPTAAAGVRMMWYPGKAGFRADETDAIEWNDANFGHASTALGSFTVASGYASTALGDGVLATGNDSTAIGVNLTASGDNSVALGIETTASGGSSTSMGFRTTASGNNSFALGSNASTNNKDGSFVYGDASTMNTFSVVNASAPNQFVVRAQNIWLGKNNSVTNTANRFIETSTGAYLSVSGVWTDNSSYKLKTNFAPVDARSILRKVLSLPI